MNPELDWDWFEDCLKHKAWQQLSAEDKEKIREHFTEESYEAARRQLLRSWQALSEDAQNQASLPPLRKTGAKPLPFLGMAAGVLLVLGLAWMLWPKSQDANMLSYAPDYSLKKPAPVQSNSMEERRAEESESLAIPEASDEAPLRIAEESDKQFQDSEEFTPVAQGPSKRLNSSGQENSIFWPGAAGSRNGTTQAFSAHPEGEVQAFDAEEPAPIPVTDIQERYMETADLEQASHASNSGAAPAVVSSTHVRATMEESMATKQRNSTLRDTFWRADTLWVRFGSAQNPDSLIFLKTIPEHWKKRKL